jgi:S1-C subfamily serine protease
MRSLYLLLIVLGLALFATMLVGCKQELFTDSTVKLVVKNGMGSGVHIGNGYVLSAAHVVNSNLPAKVTDSGGAIHNAVLLWANTEYDIALMKMEGFHDVGASELECSIAPIGTAIEGVGYPLNIARVHVWGLVASGVQTLGPWKAANFTDMSVLQGQSGGPVFNTAKKVVGLMVGIRQSPQNHWTAFSVMVPASVICTLMGRV